MNKSCQVRRHKDVLTFRKWGRKNWSVFQSLHKTIRIGCLGIGYLLFAIPANAQKNMIIAPHDSINPIKGIEMEEVVVSAQRAPVTFSQVARILTVIEKEEIQHAPVQNIQDLLEFALGLDVRQRGGPGVQSDVSIRGSSFDQVLILLNGVSINDPQTGHHNLNLPVSLDAIERIEILEGPASRVYGLNAFSGAINIITGTDQSSNLKFNLCGGQHSFYDAGLSGNIVSGNLTSFVSVDNQRSEGYIKNTDFRLTDAYYLGKLSTQAGNFEIQGGHSSRAFGANSFYTPVYPDQFEDTRTTFASVKMETGERIHFTPVIYWRRNQDRFELFRDPTEVPSWYTGHNYHLTDVYGSMMNSWFSSVLGKTALGVEFRSENIRSTVLGKPLNEPIPIPGEEDKYFTFSDTRTNFNLYLEHSVYIDRFSLSGGIMANNNSQVGRHWNYYPGVDLSWNILKRENSDRETRKILRSLDLKFYCSLNKSLRMPTFTDLYYSSPTNIGNSSLKPEEAIAFESGFKFNNPWFTGHIAYFHRWGTNIIDWVQKPDETVWKAENLTDLNTDGIELSVKLIPDKLLKNKSIIKSMTFSYSWLNQGKESGSFSSKYILDYLRHKAVLGINHSIYRTFGASWEFSYQDRNGTYTKWEGSSYGNQVPYNPVWLADARLYWQKKNTNIYIEVSNLQDQKYMDYGNLEQPGRWIKIGIKKQFDL